MKDLLIIYYEPKGNGDSTPIDISDIVTEIALESTLDAQPTKLSLNVVGRDIEYVMGAMVQVKVGDKGLFQGFLFTANLNRDEIVSLVAYDQTRYLKNQDTFVFEAKRLDEIVTFLCNHESYKLKMGTIENTEHVCSPSIHEGKSLWDIINDYVDQTLVATRKKYVLIDNFGSIELKNIESMHSGLLIDDESVISNYDYEVSIDQNTYNQIKIGKDSKSKNERVWVVVKDSTTINNWGLLQYHQKYGEQTTDKELEQIANDLLKLYNRFSQTLSLNCRGDFRVFAGCGVKVQLDGIKATSEDKSYIVTSCVHSVKNDNHEMQINLAIDKL